MSTPVLKSAPPTSHTAPVSRARAPEIKDTVGSSTLAGDLREGRSGEEEVEIRKNKQLKDKGTDTTCMY
jgi:hypothetical protein